MGNRWVISCRDEAPGKGTFSVRHAGVGEPPKEGYFKKHEPGEVAEFHLFVPDGLEAGRRYPLLIVYHGGKDGASGKGMCRRFAKLSTVQHPVIVLSPNMYTMDAYNELVAEGKLGIDTRRVVVYGHSSGGMGVRSAMAEYTRTDEAFVPAALISSSTTASLGRAQYPPCPYYVMAGEKETPEYVTNRILKDRRRTCRVHALTMQQVFPDVRYVEVQGSGHAGGTPAHQAVIQHAIAVSERAPVELPAARDGAWLAVREELERLDEKTRGAVLRALERWFATEVQAVGRLAPDSTYVERDRAFLRYDRCREVAEAFADTGAGSAQFDVEEAGSYAIDVEIDGVKQGEPIAPGQEAIFGRHESCAYVLPDPHVSRRQFRVENLGTRVEVEGLPSKNRTHVLGRRAKEGVFYSAPEVWVRVGNCSIALRRKEN
ncbi:MAG: FHA domain-containing protein [Planctomycetota bacterium]